MKTSRFKRIPYVNRACWQILNTYQKFYERADINITTPSRFKIARFINRTKEHQIQSTKERTQLIIIQLLFHLLDKNTQAIEKSTSAIEKHIIRIKLRLESQRSYTLIKMLLSIPANQYHSEAIERHTRLFRRKLQKESC